MDIYNLVRGTSEWLGVPATLVGAIAASLLLALLVWRASSLHPILSLVWRLLDGRSAASSTEIEQFMKRRSDLVRFRFISGIRARTVERAERIGRWSRENDEEPGDISKCADLFDLEECRLIADRIPSKRVEASMLVVAMMTAIALICGLAATSTNRALVQFKVSRAFFTLSSEYAQSLDGKERVNIESCKTASAERSARLTPAERSALCNLLGTSTTRDYVRDAVAEQRALAAPISLALAIWLALQAAAIRSVGAARSMSQRLNKRALSRQTTSNEGGTNRLADSSAAGEASCSPTVAS